MQQGCDLRVWRIETSGMRPGGVGGAVMKWKVPWSIKRQSSFRKSCITLMTHVQVLASAPPLAPPCHRSSALSTSLVGLPCLGREEHKIFMKSLKRSEGHVSIQSILGSSRPMIHESHPMIEYRMHRDRHVEGGLTKITWGYVARFLRKVECSYLYVKESETKMSRNQAIERAVKHALYYYIDKNKNWRRI